MRDTQASISAQSVALARAHLDWLGVIEDPWARRMLTPGRQLLARVLRTWPVSTYGSGPTFTFLAARTLFFDDAVIQALDESVRQVVILGAGYDSRGLRLARPSVTFYEVDHPATQSDKQRRSPATDVVFVPADLQIDGLGDALCTAGFAVSAPAIFIVEGLTMYLTKTTAEDMFADLAALAAPGSRLAVNFSEAGGGSVTPVSRAVARVMRVRWRLSGEPTHYWATTENVPPMLARSGWTPNTLVSGAALATQHLSHTTMHTAGVNPRMFCVATRRSPEQRTERRI